MCRSSFLLILNELPNLQFLVAQSSRVSLLLSFSCLNYLSQVFSYTCRRLVSTCCNTHSYHGKRRTRICMYHERKYIFCGLIAISKHSVVNSVCNRFPLRLSTLLPKVSILLRDILHNNTNLAMNISILHKGNTLLLNQDMLPNHTQCNTTLPNNNILPNKHTPHHMHNLFLNNTTL